MPIQEILRAVVFLNRTADNKDFNEVINCIPDERMKDLETGLIERKSIGEVNTVHIGRHRTQATNFTDYSDEVDKFFEKIDKVRIHSSMNRAAVFETADSSLSRS